MDQIFDTLTALAGGEMQLIVLAAVFAGAMMATLGARTAFSGDAIGRRLAAVPAEQRLAGLEVRRRSASKRASGLSNLVAPKDERELLTVHRRLIQAGFRGPHAVRNYYLVRTFVGLLLPAPLLIATLGFAVNAGSFSVDIPLVGLSASSMLVTLALLVLLGFYLPPLFIRKRIKERQRAIREGFPHALDLMQVAVQAGLGFDAALAKVGEELQAAHRSLAEEFLVVVLELRAGKSRERVLQDLAERTGVEEIQSFQTVMLQSIRYGTSISDALEVYAAEMRHKRMMNAEEMANKLPVKMSVVMVTFLLPTMFLIFLGPMFIRFARVIFPLLLALD